MLYSFWQGSCYLFDFCGSLIGWQVLLCTALGRSWDSSAVFTFFSDWGKYVVQTTAKREKEKEPTKNSTEKRCRGERWIDTIAGELLIKWKNMLHISKHDAHSGNVIMFALLPHSLSFIVLLQLINPFHCAVHVMPHLLWPGFSRLGWYSSSHRCYFFIFWGE